MLFSLITVAMGRLNHLKAQTSWLDEWLVEAGTDCELVERVIVTDVTSIEHFEVGSRKNIKFEYRTIASGGFNKAQLLNVALERALGKFSIFVDVDLLPAFPLSFLIQHQGLFSNCIFSGYRIDVDDRAIGAKSMLEGDGPSLGPEDGPSAQMKYLLAGHRFGVCPVFTTAELRLAGGLDVRYRGWGGEDQELIERLQASHGPLLRSPDYLWAHLRHPNRQDGWNDPTLTQRNRELYRNSPARQENLQRVRSMLASWMRLE